MDLKHEAIADNIKAAMDLTAVMAAEEIATDHGWTQAQAIEALLSSSVGEQLYDDTLKLWWMGPSAVAELFEMQTLKVE